MHCTCQRLAMAVMSTLRSVGGLGWLIVALEDRSSTTAAAVAGHSNLFARRDEARRCGRRQLKRQLKRYSQFTTVREQFADAPTSSLNSPPYYRMPERCRSQTGSRRFHQHDRDQ
jgi:hypothetical protein